jgi:hypothetical protein
MALSEKHISKVILMSYLLGDGGFPFVLGVLHSTIPEKHNICILWSSNYILQNLFGTKIMSMRL